VVGENGADGIYRDNHLYPVGVGSEGDEDYGRLQMSDSPSTILSSAITRHRRKSLKDLILETEAKFST